jgi:hypothetical protein
MDPLSCLAHESSSLCSFQCTRRLTRGSPAIAPRKMGESLRFQGRALKAEQCSPTINAPSADRLRRSVAHGL